MNALVLAITALVDTAQSAGSGGGAKKAASGSSKTGVSGGDSKAVVSGTQSTTARPQVASAAAVVVHEGKLSPGTRSNSGNTNNTIKPRLMTLPEGETQNHAYSYDDAETMAKMKTQGTGLNAVDASHVYDMGDDWEASGDMSGNANHKVSLALNSTGATTSSQKIDTSGRCEGVDCLLKSLELTENFRPSPISYTRLLSPFLLAPLLFFGVQSSGFNLTTLSTSR